MTLAAEYPLEMALAVAWPTREWRDSHVVLAVSGGPDSTSLLRAIRALKHRAGGAGRLICAHFHHGLRGVAADEDQAWLEKLCRNLDIPLTVGRTDPGALRESGDGWEATARRARYEYLRQTAERLGARFVAVAHTADDQVETALHHILRGTGLAGLAGMPRVRPLSPSVTLVRPLLDVSHTEVLQYLGSLGQDFRSDATNSDRQWMRNRLRNELLPLLRRDYKADVDQSLRRLAQQAGEAQQYLAAVVADLVGKCVQFDGSPRVEVVRIAGRLLEREPPLIVREVCKAAWSQAGWPLKDMGFDQWQQLAGLVMGEPGSGPLNLPGNVRAVRERDVLQLRAVR